VIRDWQLPTIALVDSDIHEGFILKPCNSFFGCVKCHFSSQCPNWALDTRLNKNLVLDKQRNHVDPFETDASIIVLAKTPRVDCKLAHGIPGC
jgi:hypothetical protein